MSSAPQKFFLTTPIYYVNARPHIGHAYTTIVADVLARRHRLLGDDTFLLTGTDEHGQKIERSAAAAAIPPQQFADEVSAQFRTLWDRMGLKYDDYIRTTEPRHQRGAQKLFAELYARGAIYLSSYTGQYCVSEEIFVEGPPGVIGPDGKPTETVTEENFFFRLSDYQLPLLNLIESDTLAITPESRKNEVLSFLRGNLVEGRAAGAAIAQSSAGSPYVVGALRDLSVSRSSFSWGIPVPEPAASATEKKHVMYVWLDALANYMTAVGYGTDTPEANAMFARYWPANVHIMAKEITRQHCIYWPAFLLAAGLPLPRAVTAHGWLLFDDSKMSKSKGNIVRTETILDAFGPLCPPQTGISSGLQPAEFGEKEEGASAPALPTKADQDLFASDVLRYFLLREIPFGQDGSFSFDTFWSRYDSDLGSKYGNLVKRTLGMIESSSNNQIPNSSQITIPTISDEAEILIDLFPKLVDSFEFSRALELVWTYMAAVDGYLASQTPWKKASLWNSLFLGLSPDEQTNSEIQAALPWNGGSIERLRELLPAQYAAKDLLSATAEQISNILYAAAEAIRIVTALLHPILPFATASVWAQLGLGDIEAAARNGELKNLQWGGLKPGTKLGPLSPIFPRADKGIIALMNEMESANAPKPAAAAPEPVDSTHPAAAPRTSTLAEPNPGAQVGASTAATTERTGTPSHTEAASGIFSGRTESPQITIDDFAKVELRVAKILVAERIPKADKLLRLEVDLGYEKRQILSGIAEHYTPEELIGRRIVVITNLAPRKMRGLESHGMLLAASDGEHGKPVLASFADSDEIPLGSRLK